MDEHEKLTEHDEDTGEPFDVCPTCSEDWPCRIQQRRDAKRAADWAWLTR